VYRTEDPRATHLRRFSKMLGEKAGQPQWFAMSQRSRRWSPREEALSERRLLFGVDVLLDGIPIDLYTPIFAVSRISAGPRTCSSSTRTTADSPAHRLHRPAVSAAVLPLDQR
jgi:citrate synthase